MEILILIRNESFFEKRMVLFDTGKFIKYSYFSIRCGVILSLDRQRLEHSLGLSQVRSREHLQFQGSDGWIICYIFGLF